MKKVFYPIFAAIIFSGKIALAQTVANANVYPSNLEENMYYEKYDDKTKKITGITFMVLSDGDDSKKITPAFNVKLYLLPEGKTSKEDLIIVKTYDLKGIYHMGKHDFTNEEVDLSKISGLASGNYRFGIWVNADASFKEDPNDNATLFRGTISYTAGAPAVAEKKEAKKEEVQEKAEEGEEGQQEGESWEEFMERMKREKEARKQAQAEKKAAKEKK